MNQVIIATVLIIQCIAVGEMATTVVLVHGGAGDIADSGVPLKLAGVKTAVQRGYDVLATGGSALDAAQAAVESMEDDAAFNCGHGSVLNLDGEVEMDAIVMDGASLRAGCVGGVRKIQHPIALARLVMERSPHVFLIADGANRFAADNGIPVYPEYKLVTEAAIKALENFINNTGSATTEPGGVGTVGAVVLDANGHVAVATSTGGTTGKMPGRLGDTPLPGSGGYADDRIGAVSTTGHGESIMKVTLAARILNLIEQGSTPTEATKTSLEYMAERVGQTAGAITVSAHGDIGIAFNSKRMAWAYKKGNEDIHVGIEQSDPLL